MKSLKSLNQGYTLIPNFYGSCKLVKGLGLILRSRQPSPGLPTGQHVVAQGGGREEVPGAQLVGVRRVGQALLHVARRRGRGDGRGVGEMMPHLAGGTLTTTNLNNPPGDH